jgi:hypothetical protein
MLIENAVLCWARLAVMELRYSAVTAASNALASVELTEKRLNHAQKPVHAGVRVVGEGVEADTAGRSDQCGYRGRAAG